MAEPNTAEYQESGAGPETDQPGLHTVRDAVHKRIWSHVSKGISLRRDVIAGLNNAISSVPDGMANGALLGVSPVHGLYATM